MSESARSSGILLHPTSLPGPFGIGDLGPEAHRWVDTLSRCRQKWWQVLPLGPTGFGDSPYQSYSSFAGNPLLVSPELLQRDGLVGDGDLGGTTFSAGRVDYNKVIPFKKHVLARAWDHFQAGKAQHLRGPFDQFVRDEASWLDSYTLFMALKETQQGKHLVDWSEEYRLARPEALARARRDLAKTIGHHQFVQFLFFRQWNDLRNHAHERGVRIIGDIPIFVSSDSSDVWGSPEFFQLDQQRRPKVVAGVPPDYFSADGQLWGNPLYEWEALKKTNYAWWMGRLRASFRLVDLLRLDHFRAFESYWEIPAGMPNARVGKWVKGPGASFLEQVGKEFGGLPLIAEDLGLITPEVLALREKFDLPGMRVLHFAFADSSENLYLPHNYVRRTVVYSGTHDNDTTRGWYSKASEHEKDHVRRYLARDGHDIAWDFIRLALASVADYAIVPLQDVLNLDSDGRMNTPGVPTGNWGWRLQHHQLTHDMIERLASLTTLYGR